MTKEKEVENITAARIRAARTESQHSNDSNVTSSETVIGDKEGEGEPEPPKKRKRGRPMGSKNKTETEKPKRVYIRKAAKEKVTKEKAPKGKAPKEKAPKEKAKKSRSQDAIQKEMYLSPSNSR